MRAAAEQAVPRRWPRRLCGLLALLLLPAWAQPLPASADPLAADSSLRVALVTIAPGALYWERFGHNAILIDDRERGQSLLYNFGYFDFDQANFFLNFIRGRMLYRLAATDPLADLAAYRDEGRSVWVQELALDAAAARALATALAEHARPEHAEYRYDYYANNCSTKVRDALDWALHGALRARSIGRGRGETYRSLSLAYAAPEPWLALGIDLGLGPAADRRISFWEEAFLPMRLRDLVAEVQLIGADGSQRPLLHSEIQVVDGTPCPGEPVAPRWRWRFALLGLALACLPWFGLRARSAAWRKLAAAGLALGSLLLGLAGLGLLGLWCCTDHEIAWANANLALFSPLALGLVWPLWRLHRRDCLTGWFALWTARLILLGIAAVVLLGMVKFNVQHQNDWLALLLPWHLLVWVALGRAAV